MKTILVTTLAVALALITYPQSSTIILEVEGINISKGGEISAGIFEEANFPKVGQQKIGSAVKVNATSMRIVFNNVSPGIYGAAVFQDIDSNKDLATNWVGLPKEPIGFSNDARIKMGPPAWADAKFVVEPNSTVTLKIILR